MIKQNPAGKYPQIHKTAFIDPTAVIIGNVKIGKNVFVGPLAVIRADEPGSRIFIGDNCNVQDRVIVHALTKSSVTVGKFTSLSHGSIIHGPCKIGKNCFIGFGSVVFKSTIGDGVTLKHLVVVEDAKISSQRKVESCQAIKSQKDSTILKVVDKSTKTFTKKVIKANQILRKGYRNE